MTPEQALAARAMLLPDVQQEAQTTRKVLAALPADQNEFRPHEKSMPALKLGWHMVAFEIEVLQSIAAGAFPPPEERPMPGEIKNSADLVAYYDREMATGLKGLEGVSGEDLAKPISFYGAFEFPAVTYLNFLLKHSIHHRGQMAVYLRVMGAKVPSIYGGSADEPWQPPATEAAGA